MTTRRPSPEADPHRETAWKGDVARWYDALVGDRGSDFQQQIIFPQLLRLLDLKKGQRLLDLACGQGAFCRVALEAGVQVTGLDSSEEMIKLARERSKGKARYILGNATNLGELPEGYFDAIGCVLAIQNIDPLEPVFAGCARVLRPGGKLVLVMNHLSFRVPRQSAWAYDEERKLVYRRVDTYLSRMKIPIQTHPGSAPGLTTWTFHRPLQDYVSALAGAGLWVNALEEWPSNKVSQPGPRGKAENRARKEIPLFLGICARKVQIPSPSTGEYIQRAVAGG